MNRVTTTSILDNYICCKYARMTTIEVIHAKEQTNRFMKGKKIIDQVYNKKKVTN